MMFYKFAKALVWLFFHVFYRVELKGMENLPEEGALICPNHFSLYDPLLIAVSLPKQIRFMAKNELFKNPLLRWFLFKVGTYPVKRGEPDLSSIKTTLRLLKENAWVGLFPEGTRIRNGKLGTANPGVALFAIKANKPVVPIAITGRYRFFCKINIIIGQPIDFSQYKKDKMTNDDYYEISQIVMQHISILKGER